MTTTQQSYRPHHNNSNDNEIIYLSTLSGYQSFGTMLALIRTRVGKSQQEIADASKPYLRSRKRSFDRRMYGRLENDDRFVAFAELEPIFRTFVQAFGVQLSDAEVALYVMLAQKRHADKRKKREPITGEQWDRLAETLASINNSRRSRVHLVEPVQTELETTPNRETESSSSRRRKALQDLLRTDTSHLLEREDWLQEMLKYPSMQPAKKLIVVQGAMGVGKSHALALLAQHLVAQQQESLYLIPYRFEPGIEKTPDDQLNTFLATVIADLLQVATDEARLQSVEEQVEQMLSAIKARAKNGQKVVFLLDDAQEIFPTAAEWSPAWESVMQTFVKEPHSASIFLFTRTWPGWPERRRSYLEETDLHELSLEAGIVMWQRFGFITVPEKTLQQVVTRWGSNPQLIEMRASGLQKSFTYGWRGLKARMPKKNDRKDQLETLLAQESLFDQKMDVEARKVLEHVVTTTRLSHLATRMLEVLAMSPLGVPFPLLAEEFPRMEVTYDELLKASLVDLGMAAANRAAVAPLVREAQLQTLLDDGRKDAIESRVTDLYALWLNDVQDFKDDAEKSALIAEMVVRYIRSRQLLKAAELFISFGWLCSLYGHTTRVQRVFEEVVKEDRGKEEDVKHEVGRLILQHRIAVITGEKVDPRTRDTDFHYIRDLVLEGRIALQPHPEVYLAYTLMLRIVHEKRYQDAYDFLQETMNRVATADKVDPEVRASFLHNKAHLLGRWSSHATEVKQLDEALRLRSECVEVLIEVVKTWRACLRNSLPMQERYYHFKMARALNDLAYYSRMLGHLNDAEQAIIECLDLKQEKKATLPRSLAVSLGEYAQILKAKGQYRKAEEKNDQAIQYIDQIIQSGDSSAYADKGMLLVERAAIYEMQGRLNEAKQLLIEAVSLLNEDRDEFRFEAEQHLTRIQVIEESSTRYHMDSRWYARYLPLAKYDDLRWLSQAGPFTSEEQRTWDHLYLGRNEEKIWHQLAEIIQHSKEREFEQSTVEGRLPRILYPAIDVDDIRSRMRGFSELKEMIEREEANSVVRRLYVKKIEEHLLILRLVEATYRQDITGLRACNEALYGEITKTEMTIALREFFKMLRRAQNHPQAKELVEQILQQLKQWHLFAEDFITSEDEAIKRVASKKLQQWRRTPVSSHAVQQLYEEVLKSYGFAEWQVILSPERDGIALDLDLCHLYLPTNDHFTALSAAELLTEEIETHILRSVAGKRSKLALLGSGTHGYLPAEEGLAALAIQDMMDAQGLGQKSNSWTTTLSPGMAAGVLIPPQSFGSLYDLFAKAFLANHLQSGRYETLREAEEAARYDALVRISRTFRGIPDLEATGVCNLKDRVYQQGYREVSDTLTKVPRERLYVGSIGVHDLGEMEELHILQPSVESRHLAHDPQLFEKIIGLQK